MDHYSQGYNNTKKTKKNKKTQLLQCTLMSWFSWVVNMQNVSFIKRWYELMMAGDLHKNMNIDSKEYQSCQADQREGVHSLELKKVCRS